MPKYKIRRNYSKILSAMSSKITEIEAQNVEDSELIITTSADLTPAEIENLRTKFPAAEIAKIEERS